MDETLKQYVTAESTQLKLLWRAVESARNGIIVTDPKRPDNPIIYSNPAFTELTGFRREQILGRNCRFLQRDDRDQPAIERVREAIRHAEPVTAVLRNYRKNGRLFWNELTVSPVFDDSNDLVNFIGIQNDVTARIEAERRVSEFYSMISHEVKTPLASIHLALTNLLDERLNPQVRKLLNIAVGNSTKLQGLIEHILDWKRLESGKFKLSLQQCFPEAIVDSVLDEAEPLAERARVKLVKRVESFTAITGDPQRLEQALSNFVSNAIKFSPPESEIVVAARDTECDTTRFSVTDHGPGIPESERDFLFIHFHQLGSQERRTAEGTGLGLAIAKSIVELHGGHVGVESEEGAGSTFWFEIFHKRR
jgi:PAS domain S-box-containing protein